MELLPSESERTDLLDALGNLIAKRGFETFIHAPLLEPDSRFFPDPWEPSKRGVRALALRLLRYADLDLDATVGLYDNREHQPLADGEEAAAWFAGIHDGVCRFGADVGQLTEATAIVGSMSHEVAHAYREFHELRVRTRIVEEQATDLTTVYLGFGVLTLNAAYRFRTGGYVAGGRVVSSTRVAWLGYLSVQAMAFLLAAQIVVRDTGKKERARIASLLETNQAACFEAACEVLGAAEALRVRLGIPPKESWPAHTSRELPALPPDALFVPRAVQRKKKKRAPSGTARKRVYRVRTPNVGWWSAGFALVGAVVGRLIANPNAPNTVSIQLGVVLCGYVAGLWFGARMWSTNCSGCGATNDLASSICAKCGGSFVASAWRPIDYLAFDEAETDEELQRLSKESETLRREGLRRTLRIVTGIAALLLVMFWWPF